MGDCTLDVLEFLAAEAGGIALAAVEQGQLVAVGARGFDEVRAEETGAAEHQYLQRLAGPALDRATTRGARAAR